jgi:hypothetical protein
VSGGERVEALAEFVVIHGVHLPTVQDNGGALRAEPRYSRTS